METKKWRITVHMANGQVIQSHWRETTLNEIVAERNAITAAMIYGGSPAYEFTDSYATAGADVSHEHYIHVIEINEIVLEFLDPKPSKGVS